MTLSYYDLKDSRKCAQLASWNLLQTTAKLGQKDEQISWFPFQ
jgi:hypothetical protein